MLAVPYVALAALTASLFGPAVAAPSPTAAHVDEFARRDADAPVFVKRAASCTFPSPPKTSSLSKPISVTGTFDGGNVRFDRGSGACNGQAEGEDALEQAIIPKVGVRFSIEVSNKCEARKCPNLGAYVPFICSTSITNLVGRFVGPNLA
ncbi:hypothetical protein FRC12_024914 [Ceratobasidium sp. 428]|nr:hypothetical protein FRC12_024914 [Ceratobasidium sp. 428]